MAEFQLNRIRFTWKGPWVSGTDYVVDDMIEYEGKTYVAKRVHTATTFSNDVEGADVSPAIPKWELQSDGTVWKGNWTVNTTYSIGAIVKYGSGIYQCIEEHISSPTFSSGTDGLIEDITKWKVVAVSDTDWKYNWSTNTLYRRNDIVRYNGRVYKALEQHISAATNALGLEANQSNWSVLSDGTSWRGDWGIGTRYRTNDIVKYGGIVYTCIVGHTSADNSTLGLEEDQSKWEILVDGTQYRYDWLTGIRYRVGDVVKRGPSAIKCITAHTASEEFADDSAKWEVFIPGQEYEGEWEDGTRYQPGDIVRYGGYTYKSLTYNVSTTPSTNPSDWDLNIIAYNFRNEWNNEAGDVEIVADYKTGDVVRFSGNLYAAKVDNTGAQPDVSPDEWEILVDGRQFRNIWEDNTEYHPGDIVTWQGTSYVCLTNHLSTESDSRPDLDVEQPDQNYWKYMIKGTLTNKLARIGDIKTYDDQDSTAVDTQRLAIGTTGQGLRSTSGLPSWDSLDKQNEVYYVATHGIDDPQQGGSMNAPFRTVRYATEYILEDEAARSGLRTRYFDNATDLLRKNVDFVRHEVLAWIDDQITQGESTFWDSYTYNDSVFESDVKLLVDAIRYDITFDANYQTVSSALRYIEANSSSLLATQKEQTLEALKKAKDLTEAELDTPAAKAKSNELWNIAINTIDTLVTPAFVYPTPTGGTNNASNSNFLNARETLVNNRAFIQDEVVAWISDQVTNGNTPFDGNFTYDVTSFRKDLGLIVDALIYDLTYGGNTETYDTTDSFYNGIFAQYGLEKKQEFLAALLYLKGLVGDVITETAVTPSPNNGLLQFISGNPGNAATETFGESRIQEIYNTVNANGSLPALLAPDITWTSAELQTEFANLGTTEQNSIATATTSWIDDQVAGNGIWQKFSFDSTKCQRDLTNIITDVAYDVALGTNYNGVFNALAYMRPNSSYVISDQKQETIGGIRHAETLIEDEISDSDSLTRLAAAFDEIVDAINAPVALAVPGDDVVSALTFPAPSGGDQNKTDAKDLLQANIQFIKDDVLAYIQNNYLELEYNGAKCARDVEHIVNALSYDVLYGGTQAASRIAESYFVDGDTQIYGQTAATAAAYAHMKSLVQDIIQENAITPQTGNPSTVVTTGSPASATEAAELANNMDIIIDVIEAGTVSGMPAVVYPDITWADTPNQTDKAAIDSARSTIISSTISYIGETYTFSYDKQLCGRDTAIIINGVVQDMTYTGNQMTRMNVQRYFDGATSYVSTQTEQTVAALNFARDLINGYVLTNTEYDSINGISDQVITGNTSESGASARVVELMSVVTGTLTNGIGSLPALQAMPRRGGATIRVMTGDYAEVLPISVPEDVAIVGDELRSTTIRPAIQGQDVVLGPVQEDGTQVELEIPTTNNEHDMFYVRNGCGIRQLSLKGLTGSLSDANDYGTKRPTGGAYVSLDPGEGPDDQSVWVRDKSTYIQGVTTIGDNCVGMKIDGSLHNGGNRSCVANDFTQVLSDGIGYWAANGGRSELVSVFTYYAHIGYLAEDGGILRATNGNNSYGTFGSVAEGFDATETPITGEVNNQSKEAQVEKVYTDSDEVMAFGYSNAGQGYSQVSIDSINTAGLNLDVEWEELRENAISDVRILKPEDSATAGGAGYKFFTNFAQNGGLTSITLAQSEERLASQVEGMRIYITSGPGVGQYGYIHAYNPTNKEATVYKESTGTPGWDHINGSVQLETELNETTKYEIEPRVSVASPTYASTPIVTRAGNGIMGYAGGNFYYPLSGTNDVEVSTDSGATWTTYQLASSATWSAVAKSGPMMLLTSASSSTLYYSNEGTLWDNVGLGTSQDWTGVAVGGRDNDTVILCASGWDNVIVGTITVGVDSSIAPSSWSTVSLPASRDWVDITYGAGLWIIISSDGYTTYSTDNGANWVGGLLPAPASPEQYAEIVWGNNSFVATLDNADRIMYSPDGVNWLDSDLVGDSTRQDWSVAYAAGVFVTVSNGGSVLTSEDSATWVQRADANGGTVAAGVENGQPTWVTKGSTDNSTKITYGKTAIMRVTVANNNLDTFIVLDPGSGYTSTPEVIVTDPEEYIEPLISVNLNDGVLSQPTFYNRGAGYITALVELTGDGFADIYQTGQNLVLKNVTKVPGPGANLRLASQPDTIYRVVLVEESSGTAPNFDITVRVSPLIALDTSPDHEEGITIRENFSQVRLTGHDFLDIGTGNFEDTNYPELYVFGREAVNETRQANEVVEANGGRVFYTSTDQDGNFRVGELFRVAQASGGVTLNADFFDLEGLDELRLGGIQVGGTQAIIREFSTDNTMTANSDNVVPTQRAIAEYLENRITGGGAVLFTNKITAGVVYLTNNEIGTTEGPVTFKNQTNFEGGVSGDMLANALLMAAMTSQDDFNG
jgi:hypothetical protein